ncbi:interleukin 9 receptor [Cricetulus griseus]
MSLPGLGNSGILPRAPFQKVTRKVHLKPACNRWRQPSSMEAISSVMCLWFQMWVARVRLLRLISWIRLDLGEDGSETGPGPLVPDLHLYRLLHLLGSPCPRAGNSNQVTDIRHRCTFEDSEDSVCTLVLPPEEVLVPTDNFTITLHRCVMGQEQVSLVDSQFLPWKHVKLDPPSDLQSNVSSGRCVLTWSIQFALEPWKSLFSYELAFKKQEEAWEDPVLSQMPPTLQQARHKDRIFGVTWLSLEAVELNPGSIYEARLRVQMTSSEEEGDMAEEEYYTNHWSLLLPSWRWSDSILVAVSVFLLLTGLIHLLFKLSPR